MQIYFSLFYQIPSCYKKYLDNVCKNINIMYFLKNGWVLHKIPSHYIKCFDYTQ